MQLRRTFPRSDVRFCLEGFRHAFVVDAGREMGDIVKNWMRAQNILPFGLPIDDGELTTQTKSSTIPIPPAVPTDPLTLPDYFNKTLAL